MTTVADTPSAQRCQGTPTLAVIDNRGLVVRSVQYNRTAAEDPLDELITQQTYSGLGHLSSSIDPRLLAEQQLDPSVPPNFRYQTSLSGRELKVRSQDAGDRLALYDVEGGVVWQRDSRDQQLSRTFDTLHRLTSISEVAEGVSRVSERLIYADATASSEANQRGQLLQLYSPAGLTLTPSYSITGQLLTSQQQFLRDTVLLSDWGGTESIDWAALTPDIHLTRWTYDALGQQVQLTDAQNNQQRQRFNLAGQLAASELLLNGDSTPQAVLRRIDYSAAGQVLLEEAGNGVVSDYVYEPQTQRLSTLITTRPAHSGRSTLLQALSYQYDPVGNLLAINDAAKATRYTRNQRVNASSQYRYDALYQLCQASGRENANAGQQTQALPPAIVPLWQEANELTNYTRTYSYDRGQNLTAIQHVGLHPYTQQMVVASTSNRAVQQTLGLTSQDVDGFFDACGNLQQLTAGQPLTWDSRNQLLRTTQVLRSGPDDDHEVYWYDSAGQRATKLGTALTSGTTRTQRVRYLPGLELRITEQTQSGSTSVTEALQVIQFAAAGRLALRVLHWEQGQPAEIENNQYRYSLDDQLGSSLLEVDQQADILTWEEYFPFGGTAVWSARNETETQYKFVRYSGQERDATGLYYYGFRYYAPWLGRWLNPDPAGTVDGLNLFCMVGNNPIIQKDVGGLGIFSCCWGGDGETDNNEPLLTSEDATLTRPVTPSALQIVNDDGTDLNANPFARRSASANVSIPIVQSGASASALPEATTNWASMDTQGKPIKSISATASSLRHPLRATDDKKQKHTKAHQPFYDLLGDMETNISIFNEGPVGHDLRRGYSSENELIKDVERLLPSNSQREYVKTHVHYGLMQFANTQIEKHLGGKFTGQSTNTIQISTQKKPTNRVAIEYRSTLDFYKFTPSNGRDIITHGTLSTQYTIVKNINNSPLKKSYFKKEKGQLENFTYSLNYDKRYGTYFR
ncbi:Putative insecticidal toxin complex [Pseudomonas chlororaphis]|uniref:Insecticidal toxin complex n=1 Tax=Pseudomonas chlororaphis TaxID=587753 RepID=A0A3G7TTC5_9PSED|nr:RHS repeat-associated core domain-containing protein [Pseudomonas chlororaphis]AZE50343.1 Putative insecticidal toxin complex [Pseudomonas chlororaphis]